MQRSAESLDFGDFKVNPLLGSSQAFQERRDKVDENASLGDDIVLMGDNNHDNRSAATA